MPQEAQELPPYLLNSFYQAQELPPDILSSFCQAQEAPPDLLNSLSLECRLGPLHAQDEMVVAEPVERGDCLGSVFLPVVVHEGESLRKIQVRIVRMK